MTRCLSGLVALLLIGVLAAAAQPVLSQDRPELDARIEVVWPNDGADVLVADRANVSVVLFEHGTFRPFCDRDAQVGLQVAMDDGPPSPPRLLQARLTNVGARRFLVWDFNDVDVSAARDPTTRLYFRVAEFVLLPPRRIGANVATPVHVHSNVWAYGASPEVLLPASPVPESVAPAPQPGPAPRLTPTILEIWPHDADGQGVPISDADFVNVRVAVFQAGTLVSVTPETRGLLSPVQLYGALNQQPLRPMGVAREVVIEANNVVYPVWDFDNIGVSAARDPQNRYFFQAKARDEWSNIRAYGAEGRTIFPVQDIPEQSCP